MTIIGFYKKALELSGAKNIKADFVTQIEADKGFVNCCSYGTAND